LEWHLILFHEGVRPVSERPDDVRENNYNLGGHLNDPKISHSESTRLRPGFLCLSSAGGMRI